MCAIAGLIRPLGYDAAQDGALYQSMLATMSRRGPDQQGIVTLENIALLHARLCVVDVENGIQPMELLLEGNRYILVYNGELYNTDALRRELICLGHSFSTRSDTEVLLHCYAQWEDRCLEKLNGIFAFAVWDTARARLFIARDRMGVKPLFYSVKNGCFLFASELKTLLCAPEVQPQLDQNGLAQLMLLGPGRIPGSGVFKNVFELLPGACGCFDAASGTLSTDTYWKLEDRPNTDTFEQAVEKVRYLVLDSIKRQLVSDVPVCTFLSGGLDSSLISAVADNDFTSRGLPLHTFSVDYLNNHNYFHASKFQPSEDSQYIDIMTDALHAVHHTVALDTDELVSALYEAVDARDLPGMADVDASLLLFCRQIKPLATVALSGECADEIFGGYPWYRDKTIRDREGFPWAQSTAYRAGFLQPDLLRGLDPALFVDSLYHKTIQETSVLPGTDKTEARMKQMMNLNVKWFMQTLLDRKDRMSMYSGLEVRVPFCDHRIAEYLYTVPWSYKDHNHYEKGLLRQAMTGLLPTEVLWRKKSPYPKTHNPAYLQAVSAALTQVLADSSSPLLDYVNKRELTALLHTERATPWYGQLMTTPQTIAYFLQFNFWLKKYKVVYC